MPACDRSANGVVLKDLTGEVDRHWVGGMENGAGDGKV